MNKVKAVKKFYIFKQTINEYYVFLLATYILIVVTGIIWWSITNEYVFLFSCIFIPLIYESFLVFYYNWKLNDYNFLGDVKAFNEKVKVFKRVREEQLK